MEFNSICAFSCSFECFKKHKDVDCTSVNANETTDQNKETTKPRILQFTTEDTVDLGKLAQLGDCQANMIYENCDEMKIFFLIFLYSTEHSEPLKNLLQNKHLRDFIRAVDSSDNAWKAMRFAMLEPLFIEFADECLKIVEPDEIR